MTDAERDEQEHRMRIALEKLRGPDKQMAELKALHATLRRVFANPDAVRIAELEAECAALREAIEEGLTLRRDAPNSDWASAMTAMRVALSSTAGKDFEARVRAEEREACARVVETPDPRAHGTAAYDECILPLQREFAAAIRARK
jgi:hypothetical protein